MINVLIIEDSPTTSALLRTILESDPEINIVGAAMNGEDGVRQALSLRPDLITMDIHLPGIDGFEATRRIMEESPTPIVIVTASRNSSEPLFAFNAIRAGALEVVAKPLAPGQPNFEVLCEQLITTVKLMAEVRVIRHRARRPTGPLQTGTLGTGPLGTSALSTPLRLSRPALLAIGASTGGPAALNTILKSLPRALPVPVVIVQHMSAGFTEDLVRWLQLECQMPVKMAHEYQRMQPGAVYVAPDDYHLILRSRGLLGLSSAPPVSHVRPSATVLFQSVAQVYGAEALGVLLTGMGDDGAIGLKAIRDRGGVTVAQDEATSVVYGMPKVAALMGAVEYVLPLERIASALAQLGQER